jgi:dUTP pyrophosphatase
MSGGSQWAHSLTVVRSPPDALDTNMQANFVRLDPEVEVPTTAHIGDAAVDLQCRTDVAIAPGDRASVPTGLAVAIPDGYAGLVLPRSGHALRSGIGVVNGPGLIDSGYRGEISVLLINHGSETVSFVKGDRIAQLAVVPVATVEWVEVGGLEETSRGSGGFGSTGS